MMIKRNPYRLTSKNERCQFQICRWAIACHQAPFERCNRVIDYRTTWAFFEQ